MASNQDPELASILKSLSQFAPKPGLPPPLTSQQDPTSSWTATVTSEPGSIPRSSLAPPKTQDPRRRSTTPTVDPSKIITWPPAIKYVTSNVVNNQTSAAKIRQLIKAQHDHEHHWWAGREAIVAKQQGRDGSKRKADDLLRSLGGTNVPVPNVNGMYAEDDKAELERYDEKVYGALLKMAADVDRDLRAIGIPFYAIKHDLVILEEGKERKGSEGQVDKGELRELQKKMLQLLEDLFRE